VVANDPIVDRGDIFLNNAEQNVAPQVPAQIDQGNGLFARAQRLPTIIVMNNILSVWKRSFTITDKGTICNLNFIENAKF
jgi:hypothetical protein